MAEKTRAPESSWKLEKLAGFSRRPGPLVIGIMDGVGVGKGDEADCVALARTPNLDWLKANCLNTLLQAHGMAVGLPSDDDMGNSEVGHNALGAGQVFAQGAKLVNQAIESVAIFAGEFWKKIIERCCGGGSLHLIGLLSDGNVHSHMDHLYALLRKADQSGVKKVRVHILLDGRDVPPTSALEYVQPLERLLSEISSKTGRDYRIASGGGRMLVTMDRYNADWRIVERGWKAHVLGQGRPFASAEEAIKIYRSEKSGLDDQFMPEFVVVDPAGTPVGPVQDGDTVVFYNFRGDRAIEISRAFEDDNFPYFDRQRRPQVLYAGMMQYDGDFQIPRNFLVPPPQLERTSGEYLARNGITQFACSETQKYGHITYFWNGNRGGKFDEKLESYLEIPSDLIPFEQRPWMKAAEITDAVVAAILSVKHRLVRFNYPNGDMVGHTGHYEATIQAVEAVDLALGRVLEAVRQTSGIALITADHGNADEMFERDKKGQLIRDSEGSLKVRVSHSLNPVRLHIFDPAYGNEYRLNDGLNRPGLGNVAATALNLMGYKAPEFYLPSLLTF